MSKKQFNSDNQNSGNQKKVEQCWIDASNELAELIAKGIDERPSVPLVMPKDKKVKKQETNKLMKAANKKSKIPPITCEFYDSRTDEFITAEEYMKRAKEKFKRKTERHIEESDNNGAQTKSKSKRRRNDIPT